MNSLLANRSTRRRGIAYIVLLAVTLILMAFSSSPAVGQLQRAVGFAFRPIESALNGIGQGVTSVAGAITEMDQLRTANQQLLLANQQLEIQNEQAAEVQRENDQMTALLKLRSGLDYQTVAAQVVARETADAHSAVTLDEGSDSGVKAGDVVIAAGGALAGRVTDVGPDYAHVLLMNDNQSTVVGLIEPSAATGEVVGQLGGVLVMQNIDATERPKIGDEVVTAGIELNDTVRSPYPKGLVIGQVIDVRRDANAVVQTAYVNPAIDLDKLEYVLVITNYQGGLPPAGQVPTSQTNADGTLPDTEQPYVPSSPDPTHAGATARPTSHPSSTKKP